ncbi:hypothetical protein KOI35_35430 [Actinoplanes bogorensis]|uniref:Rod shape-determining protein MreD n=1 Tax=Paractinoplanes bogorensis TaxID=1610840 RepID=A0ABS5YZG8_9ACTN|nr:hypothetical protein [Actinoplanes bogorensis]MBU2668817.1 hypothetical protein [Actinoplanes bogorensis]
MIEMISRRLSGARRSFSRATVLPFLVRVAIAVCGLVAVSVAWPSALFGTQFFVPLAVVALYPAFAPRGRGATFAALVVIGGWLVDTAFQGAEVTLWRVLTIATALYLGHSLTALAAVLPYDAVVNIDVVGLWLLRALAVVLVSAVLTVFALGLATELAGGPFLVATVVGLAGAATATLLISRLVHRA